MNAIDDLIEWLTERIPCPRCAAAIHRADTIAHDLTRAGQLNPPTASDAYRYWQQHQIIAACTAAGHPGIELVATPSRLDPAPDHASQ